MKYIAAALVVLSGALLWSAAVLAMPWMYQAGGNRTAPELASYGGVAIVVDGTGALSPPTRPISRSEEKAGAKVVIRIRRRRDFKDPRPSGAGSITADQAN